MVDGAGQGAVGAGGQGDRRLGDADGVSRMLSVLSDTGKNLYVIRNSQAFNFPLKLQNYTNVCGVRAVSLTFENFRQTLHHATFR